MNCDKWFHNKNQNHKLMINCDKWFHHKNQNHKLIINCDWWFYHKNQNHKLMINCDKWFYHKNYCTSDQYGKYDLILAGSEIKFFCVLQWSVLTRYLAI